MGLNNLASKAAIAKNPLVDQAQKAKSQLTAKIDSTLKQGQALGDELKRVSVGLKKVGLEKNTQAQVKSLLDAKLSKTILQTGPRDELMTVDPLGVVDTSILNSVGDKLNSFVDNVLSGMGSTKGIVSDLNGLLEKASDGITLNVDRLKERVTDALGGKLSALRSMSEGLQNTLTTVANAADTYRSVLTEIEGEVRSIRTDSIRDARGLLDMVGQLTGDSRIAHLFDTGAEAQLMTGVCREAIGMGMFDAVDVLISKAKNSKAADIALRNNISTAVDRGDLNTTELMIDRLGVPQVLAQAPNATARLIASYQLPSGVGQAGLSAEYATLKATLDKLSPNWGWAMRNGTAVLDLGFFNRASADALRVLGQDPQWTPAITLAGQFRPVGLLDVARRQFPLAVL